jgi:hypothetical protein
MMMMLQVGQFIPYPAGSVPGVTWMSGGGDRLAGTPVLQLLYNVK